MDVKKIENRELFFIIRGIKGGIVLAIVLIFITLATKLMAVNTHIFQENEFKYFIILFLLFSTMGGIAGKRFSNGKSTKLIWYTAYIFLCLPGFFNSIINLTISLINIAFFILIVMLIVIYAEPTNLIFKWWIKRGIGYDQ